MSSPLLAWLRQRPLDAALWLLVAALAYAHAASDIGFALAHQDFRSSPTTLIGRDFVNVYTAGNLVLHNDLAGIYDIARYQDVQASLFSGSVDGHNYSYPPISFLYAWMFALLPYGAAYLAWTLLTGLAFALAARPYLKRAGLPAAAALLLPAAIANIWAGHYGFLIAALWLAGWSLLNSRPRLAGILLGCLVVKPHMAVLLPLVLAWKGKWVSFHYAAATVCSLILVSGTIFGWDLWAAYVRDTLLFQASLLDQTQAFYMTMMPSVVPSLRLAGASGAMAWAVQAVVAVGAVAALLRWVPRDNAKAGLATAIATILVVPYAFSYDLVVVGVAALLFLATLSPERRRERILAAAALIVPLLLPFLPDPIRPVVPAALAMLLFLVLREAGQASAAPQSPEMLDDEEAPPAARPLSPGRRHAPAVP